MGPKRRAMLALAIVCVASFTGARAGSAGTGCLFGGPTPGVHAVRIDLSEAGSDFLTLELGGVRAGRWVTDEQNWHLAQGIFVINTATGALEAYRVSSHGMAPRRVVARHDGSDLVSQGVVAAEIPYEHFAARLRDGLPSGVYDVVAFGTDGGGGVPNEWWSAGVQVSGTHECMSVGVGETFDFDHTQFGGGTQVYVPGIGVAEGISRSFATDRRLVVGLIDAETQLRAASSMVVEYETPVEAGSVSQRLVPFVSSAGVHRFEAQFQGFYPAVVVAGATIDLPK